MDPIRLASRRSASEPVAQSAATIFALEGAFGAAEAQRLQDAIGKLPRGSKAIVDLRKVTRVEDAAIAVLARSFGAASGPTVSVRGLGEHQRRILKYLGVIVDAVCGVERGDAPERGRVVRLFAI
jgi:anti-anti-sigma regulatory factor